MLRAPPRGAREVCKLVASRLAVEQAIATEQAGTALEAQGLQEGINTIEITLEVALKSIPETPPRSIGLSLPIRIPERPHQVLYYQPQLRPECLPEARGAVNPLHDQGFIH